MKPKFLPAAFILLCVVVASAGGAWAGKPPKTRTWTVCKAPGVCDFQTIQAAIDAASNGDEVVVSPDAEPYHERINFSGWSATGPKAIVVRSTDPQDPAVRDTTIIDWTDESGDAVVFNRAETSASVLEGFTIQGGGSNYGPPGSGISCTDSSPTIRYCTIRDNTPTTNNGGGIRLENSSPTISSCLITDNTVASYGGGGISMGNNSAPLIENCEISGNAATTAGGIMIVDSSPRIVDTFITGNNTGGSGGGVYVTGNGTPVIENCTITGNSAHGGGALYASMAAPEVQVTGTAITGNWSYGAMSFGGGVYSYMSTVSLTDCVVSGNYSVTGGGGFQVQGSGLLSLDRCVVSDNYTTYPNGTLGGGIYLLDADLSITNSVIAGNGLGSLHDAGDTVDGGAIYFRGQTTSSRIMNSTIADNGGGLRGGISMALDADSPATVDIVNSIVYYNSGTQIYVNTISPDPNVDHSDIEGCWGGGIGNICSPPQFTTDSCGLTGYALAQGSPCIDTGTDVNAPADDLCRADVRPADGGGGAVTDMGAYEYEAQVCTITITAALYDYVGDALNVEAISPYGADAALELVGYGPMTRQGPSWTITVNGLSPAPERVSVFGPMDGCTATE